jgi:predicted lipoprotein with Yx(FWY)xxD motif
MSTTLTRVRFPAVIALAAFVVLAAAASSLSAAGRRTVVVRTTMNAKLGKTILVDLRGRTLYSLTAEGGRKFICTNGACLALWHPLVVHTGATPAGTSRLGTVKRPDGRVQVSYRGKPLYTFSGDRKRGDANGEGLKDVGIWHAASPKAAAAGTPAPAPAPYPYP